MQHEHASEVDIDQIVDYRREYGAVLKQISTSGDMMTALCPFHDDRNRSFSVSLKTGLWHCFAEDIGGNYIDFVAKTRGISTSEAYKRIMEEYHVPMPDKAKGDRARRSYSLEQYSFEKRIPKEFLARCHITNAREKDGTEYMRIPYLAEDGSEMTYRKRFAQKEFRWKYGSGGKIGLYGEWQMADIRAAGYVCLVEGESDSQSMWYMGISCLGVPGASMFKPRHAAILQDLTVYIHQEPDQGGETFLRKVIDGLREGGFIGKVKKWSCSTIHGCKDPSDLYMKLGKDEATEKIRQLLAHAEELDLEAPEVIPEALPGAPMQLRTPEDWVLSAKGISHISEKTYGPVLVCRTPIILTQRLQSLETGEEKIEIAFQRDGQWHRAIFPRSTIFTARGITVLADLGCTVTSENAKMVVRFLSTLEAENIDIITKADATSRFGWQPGGRFIPGGHDEDIVLDIDPNQRGMAAAYCQAGTYQQWVETMRPHRARDKFRFIMAAAFAAPLLRIIKQRIFFVYCWGSSKTGKSAGLKAALSVWGDPERLMVNFNATQVGLERIAGFFCDLPLGIDERQLAGKNQDSLEKIVYMISSGTGKIRGSKAGGIQALQQWRTVALATGEEPLSTATTQTGVSTRVLEIYGGPFTSEEDASLMHQQAGLNCGWAGPEFIRHLLETDEESIRTKYAEMLLYVRSIAKGKSGAHVADVSAVALADAMADTWIFKGGGDENETGDSESKPGRKTLVIDPASWERAKRMAAAVLQAQMDAETGDVNENAVQFLIDWVAANRNYFGEKVPGTCFGTLSESGDVAYIFPSMLSGALEKEGFSPRKTLRYMADKNLIETEGTKSGSSNRYTVKKQFGGHRYRVIAFHMNTDDEDNQKKEDPKHDNGERKDLYHQETLAEMDADGFAPVPEDLAEELPY